MQLDIKNFFKQSVFKRTNLDDYNNYYKDDYNDDYNLKAIFILGSFIHPFLSFLNIYVFQISWDNLVLKISASVICISLITKNYWPQILKPFFPLYRHLVLIYNLPFLITLTLLNNNFIEIFFIWEISMIFILIILVRNWFIFLIDLVLGIIIAALIHALFYKTNLFWNLILFYNTHLLDILIYLATFGIAILSWLVFIKNNTKYLILEDRLINQKAEIDKRNILLVDDQEINLITSKVKITKNITNIVCDVARSGQEAINKIYNGHYDLILMDIQMPEINGIEASKKIRSFNKYIPIIALTSLDKDSYDNLILRENASNLFNDFISKSYPDLIFYRSITKCLKDFDHEYLEDIKEPLQI